MLSAELSSSLTVQKEEIVSFWEKHKNNPLSARNQIVASLCPQVYGLYVVKMAVALFMAGGLQVTVLIFFPPVDSDSLSAKFNNNESVLKSDRHANKQTATLTYVN